MSHGIILLSRLRDTILSQACVSVLLQLGDHDEQDDVEYNAPLAVCAAEYWDRHAQFEAVASRIKGMEHRFDLEKPYFAAWRKLHDIDIAPPDESVFYQFGYPICGANILLYYAALCGFANLVEQLIAKHPQHTVTMRHQLWRRWQVNTSNWPRHSIVINRPWSRGVVTGSLRCILQLFTGISKWFRYYSITGWTSTPRIAMAAARLRINRRSSK
jgi:hypothetical protein